MRTTHRMIVWLPVLGAIAAAAALSVAGVQRTARAQTEAAAIIVNFAFVPATLTVPVGATVTWTQQDPVQHTVTSGVPGAPDAGAIFDSPLLDVGETFSVTFNEEGTFTYFCRPHPRMRGTVEVTAADGGAQAAAPAAQPAAAPPAQRVVAPAAQPAPAAAAAQPAAAPAGPPPLPANARMIAGGLLNPRGFTWGPDGALYVAESGTPPAGFVPRMGPPNFALPQITNMNGRISRIASDGTRTTIADGLPVNVGPGGDTVGVASLAFIGNDLYAAISAGPRHGHPDFPGGVYRIGMDGSRTLIVNTDAFNIANPPAHENHDETGDELSNPYDMIAVGGMLYITDGNKDVIHVVDPAAPEGSRITRLVDLSEAHLVLTGIALGSDGNLYVTNLSSAPFPPGAAGVWQVTLDGQVSEVASGLSAAVGIAVAPDGTIYVSEFATTPGRPPFLEPPGRIVRVETDGTAEVVVAPMMFPTVMRWGADGLYATYFSVGGDAGNGAILRIDVSAAPVTAAP